ncbi:MAG: hypothetical protein WAP23_03560, partial [Candidatus Spechtbacterales bacterium]
SMSVLAVARWERRLRPLITKLPPKNVVSLYSTKRLEFLAKLREEEVEEPYNPPEFLSRMLWGIRFRSPIMNSAGMFKNGECYRIVARQGAGAYLGGTGTWNARKGNVKDGIYLPFVPYPRSRGASNWLGLPNDGDKVNAQRALKLQREAKCPVGWSVMGSPDLQGEQKLLSLVHGMWLYDYADVDFLEINESCPNTAHGRPQDDDLANRLRYVAEHYLDKRSRRIPVIVKFSNDTELAQVPALLDLLFELGFDGVNFGNTSTAYAEIRERIRPSERKLYDFFTGTFGGGVSGALLKERSLALCARAVEYLMAGPPSQEFHVIRTGGIESWEDVWESEGIGVRLNQWFTGYFEKLALHGHDVYRKFVSNGLK